MISLRTDFKKSKVGSLAENCRRCHASGLEYDADGNAECCFSCGGCGCVLVVEGVEPEEQSTPTMAADLIANLLRDGYRPGLPVRAVAAHVAVDVAACAEMECRCGAAGLAFLPFNKGRSYRCVAICSCGAGEAV